MSEIDRMRAATVGTYRWYLLRALDMSRDLGCVEELLLTVMQGLFREMTKRDVRRELDYLSKRELVTVTKSPLGQWSAVIDRYGIDVVEYTVECDPGIARPPKD
jgi:hypothetical protein